MTTEWPHNVPPGPALDEASGASPSWVSGASRTSRPSSNGTLPPVDAPVVARASAARGERRILADRRLGTDALRVLVPRTRAARRAFGLLAFALAPLARSPRAAQAAEPEHEALIQTSLLPAEFARATDVTDEGLAFVELGAARDTYLLGEPFALRLRFGFERELLRSGLVQLFQRPLDVPAQVFAPALELLEGVQSLDAGEPEVGASFALGESITRAAPLADEQRAGRTYAVFAYERRVAALRAGELELGAPLLGFAHATRFQDDFVLGAVPLDRRDVLVRGRAARITILPLPEEGRPAEFTGAIGRFTLRASAEPRELVQGASLKLSLALEGEGDLSRCEPPDLHDLAGFHLQGSLVERGAARLEAVYDLAPLDARVLEVPAIRFAYFDTTPPAGYRTIESQPIPIVVRAPEGSSPAAQEPASGADEDGGGSSSLFTVGVVLAGLALVWLARRRRWKRGTAG